MSDLPQRIYLGLPPSLQTLALTAYGGLLRFRRRGRVYRSTMEQLERSEHFSREELERLQMRRLRDVVALAYESVPLYRERREAPVITCMEDLSSLPLLDKAMLQQARERVVSERAGRRSLEIHTGGTTGRSLTIHCDRRALQRNYAFFHRFLRWAGVQPGERVATFAGRTLLDPACEKPPFWRRNLVANQLLLSSYHISPATLPHYVQALRRFRPVWIDSYPSSLLPLARHLLQANDSSLRPRAIVTSSETLSPEARETIETAFGCKVFDHYGAAEMVALITQCERGSYHANPEFGVIELVADGEAVRDGEVGEIVATGFVNEVMPLIRYRTGDLAVRAGSTCACGRVFPVFERVVGRADDVIETPDGRMIGRLDPIFKSLARIEECQIVQDGVDHVTVRFVVQGELTKPESEALTRELRRRLGPAMRITLVPAAALNRSPSGKLRTVINEIKVRSS